MILMIVVILFLFACLLIKVLHEQDLKIKRYEESDEYQES